ncbi:MAG: hypothetical protein ACXWDT_05715 [Solirubrobacterales bacterium]
MTRRRGLVILALLGTALIAAGCGGDDFKNDPRPPTPLEVTVAINSDAVQVSPANFGAGLVNFVIANTSPDDAVFELNGPVDAESSLIPARGNTVFKLEMRTGPYEASVHGRDLIEPARIEVGPDRESAQNDLLLP